MKRSHDLHSTSLLLASLALFNAIGFAQGISAFNGAAANLSAGTSYQIYVDDAFTTHVAPMLRGNENAEAMKFIITANPGTNVAVSFTLPSLLSQSSQFIVCTFDSSVGVLVEETHKRWNPNNPDMVTIGASGSATIRLGIALAIPPNADTGLFSGTVIMHADTATVSAQYQIEIPNLTTGVADDRGTVSTPYLLFQNYPNPFNPSTTFQFSIPHEGWVTLKVYDLAGIEVATLLAEELTPGTHSLNWSAEGLSSGIYYYRLVADHFSETKRFVVIK